MKKKKKPTHSSWLLISGLICATILAGCESYTPYPRPYGFHRIDLPAKSTYTTFSNEDCQFTFEYPQEGIITRDQSDSCWVDINFPQFDCKWHITARDIPSSGNTREWHFENYRRLIYQHSKMASQIKESPLSAKAGNGMLFEIYGNVGTPAQFFLVDEQDQQAVMMSLYFQTALKNDSLQPVINYMKTEVNHLLETFTWKED